MLVRDQNDAARRYDPPQCGSHRLGIAVCALRLGDLPSRVENLLQPLTRFREFSSGAGGNRRRLRIGIYFFREANNSLTLSSITPSL